MDKVELELTDLDEDLLEGGETQSLWEAELVAMSDEVFSALEASEDLSAAVG